MQPSLKSRPRPRELLLPQPPPDKRRLPGAGQRDGQAQATALARMRRSSATAPLREGHSLAWVAWACSALSSTWMVANPLYLLIILLAVVLVFLSCARKEALARLFKLFLLLGAAIFVLQVFFSIVTAGDVRGQTTLAQLPELRLPPLLGGITLGGLLTAEQLVWGATRGLQLWTILLVLGAFNAAANHYRLLRRVPAFLFHGALVTTIALALVPQTLSRLRAIREAQQLRGHRFRGLRDALPLLAPLIAGGLERSMTLAEAMEARGYGRITPEVREGGRLRLLARRLLAGSAALLLVLGAFGFLYGGALRATGAVLLALGGLLLAMEMRRLGRLVVRTRYNRERWRGADIGASLLAMAVPALLVALSALGISLDTPVFPRLQAPNFHIAAGLCLLLLAAPSILLPAGRAAATSRLEKF